MIGEDYNKACKLGKKEYRSRMMRGERPTLQVLDDILPSRGNYSEVPLGLIQIPSEQIVGTKTGGRSSAFAANFMPILSDESEFAQKWEKLCDIHMTEGIRDPIVAYEYMNKFYVQEGNKRVSVLKYFDVVSISAIVTRIVPKRTGEKENNIYYEFLDFYDSSKINYIWFSEEGSFKELVKEVGKQPGELWSENDKNTFNSIYSRFLSEFKANGGNKLRCTPGDAFLAFIKVHSYNQLDDLTTNELKQLVKKSWEEFELQQEEKEVELKMEPIEKEQPLLSKILPINTTTLKVAFIYPKKSSTSAWVYAHELGRMHLEEKFQKELTTVSYEDVSKENIESVLEQAIKSGCNLIFTTTPSFAQASVKAAIAHPKVRILNCSLNTSHRYIRTYYARMHEAKFLMGAIAGAMAENNKLGYLADYPIFGTIANINAFALGAKMINPRAKVYLEWTTKKNNDAMWNLKKHNVSVISGKDMVVPEAASRYFGIFDIVDGYPRNFAMPVWHWGIFYERLIQTIMQGTWKYDDDTTTTKAINYWWGMSAGVVDVICSQSLPIGTKRLVELLKSTIKNGEFNPFSGILYSQDGVIQDNPYQTLSPEAIVEMDWLADNVIGSIPTKEELEEESKPVVEQQGLTSKKG
ncbi:MAG: BMP family ABC transporter substrate-binding protein [Lachnospiraceae bacterium]